MRSFVIMLGLGWCLLAQANQTSFTRDVQPILVEKCVACHACYDAPCQLNLGSAEGLERGANKLPVYKGARRHSQQPTRLFIDANNKDEWRELGFFDVLQDPQQQSVLLQMLSLARQNPLPSDNSKLPAGLDLRLNRCVVVPSLTSDDYNSTCQSTNLPKCVVNRGDHTVKTLKSALVELEAKFGREV